jgi:RNA polymerase subunit RPABC4/transcription elongation factor Spt4
MDDQYKNVEKEFLHLRDEFHRKRLSEPDFKKKLKELRLQDKDGRFWTIGAQTGKWYCFDGDDWLEAKPPSLEEKRAICVHCGYENDLENQACIYCGENLISEDIEERNEIETGPEEFSCPKCGRILDKYSLFCPDCDRSEDEGEEDMSWEPIEDLDVETPVGPEPEREEQVLRFVQPFSLALFFGALGLLGGIIMGAFAGATDFLPGLVDILPSFLGELNGSLIGGLFYGLFGGIFGFFALGMVGFLLAALFNLIFSFIGGIKIRIE